MKQGDDSYENPLLAYGVFQPTAGVVERISTLSGKSYQIFAQTSQR
jgi:hypothetical protein